MKWIENFISRCVEAFGGLFFIVGYNIVTVVWVLIGFDPGLTLYTMIVSWLAINMSSLILFAERRNKEREAKEHAKDQAKIEAILHLSESVQNILQYLVDKENHNDRTDA